MRPIDKKNLENIIMSLGCLPEIKIFFLLKEFCHLYDCIKLMKEQPGREDTLEYYAELIKETAAYTSNFGIVPIRDGHLTDEYKQWFLDWEMYIRELKPTTLQEIDKRLQAEESVDRFRPTKPGDLPPDDPIARRLLTIELR